MGATHPHNAGAADEPLSEDFGPIHGDCSVVYAVHHQGGTRDFA
jgi:hypothetical protein